jgi:hypothetical protein
MIQIFRRNQSDFKPESHNFTAYLITRTLTLKYKALLHVLRNYLSHLQICMLQSTDTLVYDLYVSSQILYGTWKRFPKT